MQVSCCILSEISVSGSKKWDSRVCRQQIYRLCRQKDMLEVLELNIQEDHVHMILSIAPKYSVSGIMDYLKGRISTKLFHHYERLGKRYWGCHFWSRGYCVSTVGLNEEQIRKYVKMAE